MAKAPIKKKVRHPLSPAQLAYRRVIRNLPRSIMRRRLR